MEALTGLAKPVLIFLGARLAFGGYSSVLVDVGVPLPLRCVAHIAFALTIGLGCLWWYQESLLYVPNIRQPSGATLKTPDDNPQGFRSPQDQQMPFIDLRLTASDGVGVHGWFMPAPGEGAEATAPTLLFSHENAGNVGLRLHEFKILHQVLGVNLLAYDYRGYGFSDAAEINEEGLMRDARAAWEWLDQAAARGQINPRRVFIFGRSLGGAVTIQLAAELCAAIDSGAAIPGALRPAGMIVSNTFTCIEDMVGAIYPVLNWKIVREKLLRMRWRSILHIRRVRLPVLFIRGLKDEIVPAEHTLQLRDAAELATSVVVHTVPDGTHNDTWIKAGQLYPRWLADFTAKHFAS